MKNIILLVTFVTFILSQSILIPPLLISTSSDSAAPKAAVGTEAAILNTGDANAAP